MWSSKGAPPGLGASPLLDSHQSLLYSPSVPPGSRDRFQHTQTLSCSRGWLLARLPFLFLLLSPLRRNRLSGRLGGLIHHALSRVDTARRKQARRVTSRSFAVLSVITHTLTKRLCISSVLRFLSVASADLMLCAFAAASRVC